MVCLSRQNVPQLHGSTVEKALLGGYTVWDSAADAEGGGVAPSDAAPVSLVIASTGTEVSIAIDGAKLAVAAGAGRVQVASLPCQEVFAKQSLAYRKSVLPDSVPTISLEAAAIRGWERYAHQHVGLTTFGLSAPGPDVYKRLGLTKEAVAAKVAATAAHAAKNPSFYAGPLPVNREVL